MLEIKTQAQLDRAIAQGVEEVRFVAKGSFEIRCKNWLRVYVAAELQYDTKLVAWGSSRVVAWGSSRVVAWGSSRVEARESSSVVARESSRVEARESSSVVARESSSVVARESSSVEAWGSSRVVAWGSSRVEARESSRVEAWGSSRVEARESSSVEAWGSSRVEARESSSVVARESSRVEAWGSSRVVARESSSVVARESSSVEAWGSSRVVAWGSSRVEAWGSSRVEARESSSVVARESSSVEAWGYVSVHVLGRKVTAKLSATCHAFIKDKGAKVTGGTKTFMKLKTVLDWCNYYGVKVTNGIATVYKSVRTDYMNPYNGTTSYAPGTKPEAPDWDGGKQECGKGLHFSPCIPMARTFYNEPDAKYLECKISVKEMAVHFDGNHPGKCKARRVVKPLVEVDRWQVPVNKEK